MRYLQGYARADCTLLGAELIEALANGRVCMQDFVIETSEENKWSVKKDC